MSVTLSNVAIRGNRVRENLPMAVPCFSGAESDTNSSITITLAADSARGIIVSQVWWSYNAATVTGSLTISNGTITPVYFDILVGGPGCISFDPPLVFPKDTSVTVSVGAGGSAVNGRVGCNAYLLA